MFERKVDLPLQRFVLRDQIDVQLDQRVRRRVTLRFVGWAQRMDEACDRVTDNCAATGC